MSQSVSAGDALPADVRSALRAALPDVVDEVVAAVAEQVPGYRRPLEGRFGEGVRRGVEVALGRFLDIPASAEAALSPQDRAVYVELGRGELLQGRTLEALLGAYRVGARLAFRRFATLGTEAGLPPDAVVPLAEATFAYIDELSAASIEGFAAEQSRRAGRLDRQRQDLLDSLLSGAVDETTVRQGADAVGWPAAERLVVVAAPGDGSDGLALRLGPDALVGTRGEHVVALVPDSDRALDRRLAGRACGVSPPTGWEGLPSALRLALLALRLPSVDGPAHVEDHLADLVLLRDPALLGELVQRRLAPLDDARPGSRERLAETLLAWLAHRGARQAAADELQVHAQTVAYRMGVLRELFGAALDEPDSRFELELALRAERLLRPRQGADVGSGP
jgi:hypothetical protein